MQPWGDHSNRNRKSCLSWKHVNFLSKSFGHLFSKPISFYFSSYHLWLPPFITDTLTRTSLREQFPVNFSSWLRSIFCIDLLFPFRSSSFFPLIWFSISWMNRRLDDNFLSGTIPTFLSTMGLSRLELLGTNQFCPVIDFSSWAPTNDYQIVQCVLEESTDALIAFWNGLTDKGNLNWDTSRNLCGQTGVTCSNNVVTELYFSFLSLHFFLLLVSFLIHSFRVWSWLASFHFIPLSFFPLPSLPVFLNLPFRNLKGQNLEGTIASEIGLLVNLTILFISIPILHFLNNP